MSAPELTAQARRNAEIALHWVESFNEDVERMVTECYAADCVVEDMSTGMTLRGREELRSFERRILQAVPDRRMELRRCLPSGDTVIMEVTGVLGDRRFAGCVVLTFRDGEIVSDHTYGGPPMKQLTSLLASADPS